MKATAAPTVAKAVTPSTRIARMCNTRGVTHMDTGAGDGAAGAT
jgi:hypothetical protein